MRLTCLLPLAGIVLALATPAAAQEAEEKDEHVRIFGAGTAFGGGVAGVSVGTGTSETSSVLSPALVLPTLELQAFLPDEYSIDISLPITNIAVVSAIVGGFVWNSDVFFNFNFGKGTARGIVGPGVGFGVVAVGSTTAGSFRLPAELGLELITDNEAFGFKIMARPWAEFSSGSGVGGVGGGVVGLLGFSGYHRQ